jgi:hypothetical protein
MLERHARVIQHVLKKVLNKLLNTRINLTTKPLIQSIIYREPEPGRSFVFFQRLRYQRLVTKLDHQKLTQKTFKPQNNKQHFCPMDLLEERSITVLAKPETSSKSE